MAGDGSEAAASIRRRRRAAVVLGRGSGARHRPVQRVGPRGTAREATRGAAHRPLHQRAHRRGPRGPRADPSHRGRVRGARRGRRVAPRRRVRIGPTRSDRHHRPLAGRSPPRRRHRPVPRDPRDRARCHHDLTGAQPGIGRGRPGHREPPDRADRPAGRAPLRRGPHPDRPRRPSSGRPRLGHPVGALPPRTAARGPGHRVPRRARPGGRCRRRGPAPQGRARRYATAGVSGLLRLRSRSGPRLRHPPNVEATWRRIPVEGVPGRSVGLARRRRGLPTAAQRVVAEQIRRTIAEGATSVPGVYPTLRPAT